MKEYAIITVCKDNTGSYEQETPVYPDQTPQEKWEAALEEAKSILEDWNAVEVQLVSYDVRLDQVCYDPELWESHRVHEEILLEKQFN
jgi:hypothetical protein